jgi:hypothetical protein
MGWWEGKRDRFLGVGCRISDLISFQIEVLGNKELKIKNKELEFVSTFKKFLTFFVSRKARIGEKMQRFLDTKLPRHEVFLIED